MNRRAASLACLLLLCVSCSRMTLDTGTLPARVFFTPHVPAEAAPPLGEFSEETHATWLFWTLSVLKEPDLHGILERQLAQFDGDAIVNLEIASRYTFGDGFVSGMTLGIFGRRTVTVSGTVVRLSSETGQLPMDRTFSKREVLPDGTIILRIAGPVTAAEIVVREL